jgi:hypothetical protein
MHEKAHYRSQPTLSPRVIPASLSIPMEMPATAENIEKARSIVRAINRTFAERGVGRRVRLFIGESEEQVA